MDSKPETSNTESKSEGTTNIRGLVGKIENPTHTDGRNVKGDEMKLREGITDFSGMTVDQILKHIESGTLVLGIAGKAVETLGGVDKATELLMQGRFDIVSNTETNRINIRFQGGSEVEATLIQAGKSSKGNPQVNARIANIVRGGGIILGLTQIGISTYKYTQGTIGEVELALDFTFTGVAFAGAPGFVASIMYFMSKEMTLDDVQRHIRNFDAKYIQRPPGWGNWFERYNPEILR